jgi:hypothetical protein
MWVGRYHLSDFLQASSDRQILQQVVRYLEATCDFQCQVCDCVTACSRTGETKVDQLDKQTYYLIEVLPCSGTASLNPPHAIEQIPDTRDSAQSSLYFGLLQRLDQEIIHACFEAE